MNMTNDNINKALQVITHDHCGLCDVQTKCDYHTGECPYLIAMKALLFARKSEEEESEEGGAE